MEGVADERKPQEGLVLSLLCERLITQTRFEVPSERVQRAESFMC